MQIETIREVYQQNNFNYPSRLELSTALIALNYYEESLEVLKLSSVAYKKLLTSLHFSDFDLNTISYEELRDWRDLVEFGLHQGLNKLPQYTRDGGYLMEWFPDHLQYLLTPGQNPYRSKLWELTQIQFVYWISYPRKQQGWWLRSGYESKIDYLEKRFLLNESAPMNWVEVRLGDRIQRLLDLLDSINTNNKYYLQDKIQQIRNETAYCKDCLRVLRSQ